MTQHKKTPASLFPAALPVRLVDGQPRTTSLDIARHFDKRHDHVIRDIRALLAELPEEEHLPNFGETSFLEVVFGDAWVQDWCVVGVGNYRTQPVRR